MARDVDLMPAWMKRVVKPMLNAIVEETISYIPSRVKIEVSGLSMDEPTEDCDIHSFIGETFEVEDTDTHP